MQKDKKFNKDYKYAKQKKDLKSTKADKYKNSFNLDLNV